MEPMDLIKMLLDHGADPNAKLTKMIVPRARARFSRHDDGRGRDAVLARRQVRRHSLDAASCWTRAPIRKWSPKRALRP